MRKFVIAVTLACALSTTALAGNVPSTDLAAPTSPVVTVILTIISIVG